MTQQSPLGWGHPGSARRQAQGPAPAVGAMGTPVPGFAPHELAYLHQMEVKSAIAEYPAGDKPFVGPTISGIIMMVVATALGFSSVLLTEIAGIVLIAAAVLGLTGAIMVTVGAYRLLNALQVMYLLVRKL